jgi:hypothetical protein
MLHFDYLCPRCNRKGEKAKLRRLCIPCFKKDVSAKNRRYNIRHGFVDPDRPVGRPSKNAVRFRRLAQIVNSPHFVPTTTGLILRWI